MKSIRSIMGCHDAVILKEKHFLTIQELQSCLSFLQMKSIQVMYRDDAVKLHESSVSTMRCNAVMSQKKQPTHVDAKSSIHVR